MTTYYVDPNSGSNGNAGTSFGAAWATTQFAANNTAADDEVRLCQTAVESVATQIDFDTTSGTKGSDIRFISYSADGTTQQDGYTLQASASIASLAFLSVDYLRMVGVIFDGNSNATDGLTSAGGAARDGLRFLRCSFINCLADGVSPAWSVGEVSRLPRFLDSIFGNNGQHGIGSPAASDGSVYALGCVFHDNVSDGIYMDSQNSFIGRCRFIDNGGNGITIHLRGDYTIVQQSTFFGNTGDAINLEAGGNDDCVAEGCSFRSNGGYGINFPSGGFNLSYMDFNHFSNNTLGAVEDGGAVSEATLLATAKYGTSNINGDPLFVSETDGSEDLTPGTGSPLIGAGLSGGVIGALPPAVSSGGGGLLTHPGMSGGMRG